MDGRRAAFHQSEGRRNETQPLERDREPAKASTQVRSPSAPLKQAQREQFTHFPALNERLLAQHYLLNEDDLTQVMERRRDFNRLGYAVQHTVLNHLGRGLALRELGRVHRTLFTLEWLQDQTYLLAGGLGSRVPQANFLTGGGLVLALLAVMAVALRPRVTAQGRPADEPGTTSIYA